MASAAAINEPNFPWVDRQEDRQFRRLTVGLVAVFLVTGLIMNMITLPEVTPKKLIDISPRLAKLILDKKKVNQIQKKKKQVVKKLPEKKIVKKKAPDKKIVKKKLPQKKVAKKKVPEKKPAKKKEPQKKITKPAKPQKKTNREVAQNSGLMQLQDELASLRDSFSLDSVANQPQQTSGKKALELASRSDLLTSSAQKGSGGIKTATLNRGNQSSELTQRQTTRVKSNIVNGSNQSSKSSGGSSKSSGKTRTADEIERIFQKNKGGIFNIYNRALRKNPSLAGQVLLQLTIAPDGSVISVKILSSELKDKSLERKLILKVKKFKFSNSNVAQVTITYPIDFLPS